MATFRLRQFEDLAALRGQAGAWNELWQRSSSVRPTARAEQLAIWHGSFAQNLPFVAIGLEADGQLVAGLPLVLSRRYGIPMASSLGNAWSPGGELLLDRTCDARDVLPRLFTGLQQQFRGLLSLDGLTLRSDACRGILDTCETRRANCLTRRRFTAPVVMIRQSWQDYFDARSPNLHRQLKTIARRADKLGDVNLRRYEELTPAEVEPLLRECFELEARGWKGRQASAVLSEPRAWRFILGQAIELARCGEFSTTLLCHGDHPIAFEYGWHAKRVRGVLKVSFDESYARLSPGQLLRLRLFEQLFDEQSLHWIDFIGPVGRATGQWATHGYEVGRILASLGSRVGSTTIAAYGFLRRLRQRARHPLSPAATECRTSTLPAIRQIDPFEASETLAPQLVALDLDNPAGEF